MNQTEAFKNLDERKWNQLEKRFQSTNSNEPPTKIRKLNPPENTPNINDTTLSIGIQEQDNKILKEKDYEIKILKEEKEKESKIIQDQQQSIGNLVCTVKDLLVKQAKSEKQILRENILKKSHRLGHIAYERRGTQFQEVWKNGHAFEDLKQREVSLEQDKEELEQIKKVLNKLRGQRRSKSNSNNNVNNNNSNSFNENSNSGQTLEDLNSEILDTEEIINLRKSEIKKGEISIAYDKQSLKTEKTLLIREIKRVTEEDQSKFNNHPCLQEDRYLLLTLLGKGGFSEVYKAFDIKELRYVACKIHSLNEQWSEHKKKNYIKHAIREYNIHKSLNHARVVRLFDVFEIDDNTFCTVLEYADGGDFDLFLKTHKTLPEREAKSILIQVFSGLKYLNEQKRAIIHYDLKPGNILLSKGEVKITDFGLSKIMEEDQASIELTSQGAGTYWYLPPETFETPKPGQPLRISNKVDVWSAGVIFYQMLYGSKPFGDNLSQQKILQEGTIQNAKEVNFPLKPVVSAEGKEFIKACLAYEVDDRPDVFSCYSSKYLQPSSLKNKEKQQLNNSGNSN